MSELYKQLATLDEGVRVFDRGEFLEWCKTDNGASLIWSSELVIDKVIDVIDSTFGEPADGHRGVVDFDDKTAGPTTAARARRLALDSPERVSFLRLEFDNDVAVVWTPTSASKELESKTDFAETSIFFTSKSVEAVRRTMSRTATAYVGSIATNVVQSVTN